MEIIIIFLMALITALSLIIFNQYREIKFLKNSNKKQDGTTKYLGEIQ